MDCILFRHGIAVDRDEWTGDDSERPLTRDGAEKTRQAAAGLLRLGLVPAHVLSSPLARALETAQIIAETFRPGPHVQRCDDLVPDAPPDRLLAVLSGLPGESCVICVGHEPHLGKTAGVMVAGKPAAGLSLKKAGACCIRFEDAPKAGTGSLRWWLTPAVLRLLRKRPSARR